ncbi:hypothetical protein EI94DRAFT_1726249 [Lactarius quietus]|nr:hypothetical protein EI94DRAFT_1726249 [Lactarius quietus]
MNQSTVVLFMKVCDTGVEFSYFDILTDESVRQDERWPTYPQLIIKGEFVGGLDIVREMADTGEFRELVA